MGTITVLSSAQGDLNRLRTEATYAACEGDMKTFRRKARLWITGLEAMLPSQRACDALPELDDAGTWDITTAQEIRQCRANITLCLAEVRKALRFKDSIAAWAVMTGHGFNANKYVEGMVAAFLERRITRRYPSLKHIDN